MMKAIGRLVAFSVPALMGGLAVVYAGNFAKLPEPSSMAKNPSPVRVITVAPLPIVPRVNGFGSVEPVREWRAVSRIAGEVIEMATPLAPGDIIAEGTVLFRIDDSDLKLDLANIDAQLSASAIKDDTVRSSLELAKSDLELARADLTRQEQLNSQGVTAQSALDTARRQELTARTKVTELESQITLNGAEREVLATQRAAVIRNLGFAEIRAPYDLRVRELNADMGQFVGSGQTLLSGEGIEAVDIAAQFPIGKIGPLLRLMGDGATVFDLAAEVSLPAPGHSVTWSARVERVGEAIDAQTQSAPVVVRVTDPLSQSAAGERPPLRRNMFVEVELSAPEQNALVVPTEAVRSGTALVVSEEGTLQKRAVETSFVAGDVAVVSKGLKKGDKLVITDPSIAVPGMAVKPVEDEARKGEITAAALGQAPAPVKTGGGAGGGGGGAGKAQEGSE
ncbi:efflux RND transporter periplasmic adaptor subunit [Celeribacter neptunius]|uniref:RND family efflux transporter, MFP subunit n=1 Tax=Celeribacter neptunius TaxID=588602 RepID=A0A1I3R1C5_9RHOB|nr:efflux RND transporter periplasmic adaptor subunit [Celeribacter neptunius]SFJ39840.1 RND family efflux transporter, MFP subunit [Celeribacter neptunius]